MPEITDVTACPDCDEGLDEHGDPCATCGGWGDLPAAVAAQLAFERTTELAFELACTAPGDTEATVHLVVHCPPPFGSLHLKPLPPREALGIVLAAQSARVPVERVADSQGAACLRDAR